MLTWLAWTPSRAQAVTRCSWGRSGCATYAAGPGPTFPTALLGAPGPTCSKTWIRRWPGNRRSARSADPPSCSSGCRPRGGAAPLFWPPPPPPPCRLRPAPGPPAGPAAGGAESACGPSRFQEAAGVALVPAGPRGGSPGPRCGAAPASPDAGPGRAQAAAGRAVLRAGPLRSGSERDVRKHRRERGGGRVGGRGPGSAAGRAWEMRSAPRGGWRRRGRRGPPLPPPRLSWAAPPPPAQGAAAAVAAAAAAGTGAPTPAAAALSPRRSRRMRPGVGLWAMEGVLYKWTNYLAGRRRGPGGRRLGPGPGPCGAGGGCVWWPGSRPWGAAVASGGSRRLRGRPGAVFDALAEKSLAAGV